MGKTNKQTEKNLKRLYNIFSQPLILENWYAETFGSNFVMEYHMHPQIEIMYCVHGQFDFYYKVNEEDSDFRFVTVTQNCFIMVNTGYYHKIADLTQDTKIINLEFLPNNGSMESDKIYNQNIGSLIVPLKKLFPICRELNELVSKDKNFYIFVDVNNVMNTMKEIIRKMSDSSPSEERSLQVSLLTTNLFIDISHCISAETHKKTGIKYVDSAIEYINTHFLGKITVSEIADAVGISAVYLQKLFKAQYDKTIYRVITEKRIQQADYLLEHSTFGISEIASQCGFSCREQLVYEFQKIHGISPSKHRKNITEQKIRYFSHYGETKLPDEDF